MKGDEWYNFGVGIKEIILENWIFCSLIFSFLGYVVECNGGYGFDNCSGMVCDN